MQIKQTAEQVAQILGLDEKAEQVRRWLKDEVHRKIALAGGLFAISLFILMVYACSGGSPDVSRYSWTYDLNSGELSYIKTSMIDGQTVRAYVYSCGDCGDERSRFIGYLERGDEELSEVRTPQSMAWSPRGSEEGQRIIRSLSQRCPGQIKQCVP